MKVVLFVTIYTSTTLCLCWGQKGELVNGMIMSSLRNIYSGCWYSVAHQNLGQESSKAGHHILIQEFGLCMVEFLSNVIEVVSALYFFSHSQGPGSKPCVIAAVWCASACPPFLKCYLSTYRLDLPACMIKGMRFETCCSCTEAVVSSAISAFTSIVLRILHWLVSMEFCTRPACKYWLGYVNPYLLVSFFRLSPALHVELWYSLTLRLFHVPLYFIFWLPTVGHQHPPYGPQIGPLTASESSIMRNLNNSRT